MLHYRIEKLLIFMGKLTMDMMVNDIPTMLYLH